MFKKRKLLGILSKYTDSPEAIVVTGFRRVGKTALLKHIYESIPSDNKLFLDMESPVNQKLFDELNYENIRIGLERGGLRKAEKSFVFIDEIQNLRHLPSAVKYLYDHYGIKFYLTGSSGFYLKNWFSESMAGRKFLFELMPLDFEEFLWFKDLKFNVDADFEILSGLYEEFLRYGGFPGVVLAGSDEEKKLKLDDILGSYFKLDVQSLAHFRDNQKLKDLLFLLASRVGSKPEVGKLAESLGVSRQSVSGYLDFFEQTYLINYLRPVSSIRDIRVRSIPKIYFGDTGLLNRVSQVSIGQLFENKVFNQLFARLIYERKMSGIESPLGYYQKKSGAEIDFVVENKIAYEVKQKGGGYDVMKLGKLAKKLSIEEYKVISLEKTAKDTNGIIYPFGL